MKPFELEVIDRIYQHRYGKPAMVVFHYLQAASKMKYEKDVEGYISLSRVMFQDFSLERTARVRGIKALEELGLIEVRQEGQQAYRAKLLYEVTQKGKPAKRSSQKETLRRLKAVPDVTDELFEAMKETA